MLIDVAVVEKYISGETYSLKSTPHDRFFEKLFMAVLIYSQSFCQKSAERKSPKKYFSYFSAFRLIKANTLPTRPRRLER